MRLRAPTLAVVLSGALAVALSQGEQWRESRGDEPTPASAAICMEPVRPADPPSGGVSVQDPRPAPRTQRARPGRTAALSLVLLLAAGESRAAR